MKDGQQKDIPGHPFGLEEQKNIGRDMELRDFWIKLNNRQLKKEIFSEEPVCEYYETAVHVRKISPEIDLAYAECEEVLKHYARQEKYPYVGNKESNPALEVLAALKKARGE
jgi:hypothetical protein